MHIPDAYLSPATQAVCFAAMIPVWTIAARRTSRDLTTRQAPLLSIGAAFCFAIQMFNIPALGGTTAHALGATLLAILVGPWAAVLGMTLTLAIQALLFGDGGILTMGANCFNMAFVAPFVGYGVYRLIAGPAVFGASRGIFGAAAGSYLGTATASLSAGIMLGIQPTIAHDALGHALYCPFGLGVSVPAMVLTHLLVAAPAEAMITVAALGYLRYAFPELLLGRARTKLGTASRLVKRVAWVLVLTPIGLIAGGSAFGEWDLSELRQMVGYAPAGISRAHEIVHPLLPDYGFGGVAGKPWEIVGYLVSALVGFSAVAVFTWAIPRRARPEVLRAPTPVAAASKMPDWMGRENAPLPPARYAKTAWFESTVARMQSALAKTVSGEASAGAAGCLQSLHPTAKAVGFLCALVATGLSNAWWELALLLSAAALAGALSHVPIRELGLRILASVMFFGLILAVPVSLQAVTSGPVAVRVAGIALSTTGLHSALMLLLRLSAGISFALLWAATTKWHELLRSFGSLGVPRTLLAMATLTYRYLFVMLETLGEMVEARASRQVGACGKDQARAYAGAGAAVLFAKSVALTEETHLAMRSRGFDGSFRTSDSKRWRRVDSVAAIAGVVVVSLVLGQGVFHVL